MNPLALLPILAAAVLAAPGAQILLNPVQPYAYAQIPLGQPLHYQGQPVVSGYSSYIVNPALAHAPIAYQSILPSHIAYGRQLPELTPPPNDQIPITPPPNDQLPITPPGGNSTSPPADLPGLPGITPPGQSTTAAPENGTSSDQGNNPQLPIPGSPIVAGGSVDLH